MTVAVAVNKILTDSEKEEIENLVMAAGGMNPERGDVVNVSSLKFTQEEVKTLDEAQQQQAMTYNIIDMLLTKVAPLVVLLVLGLVALQTFANIMKRSSVEPQRYVEEVEYVDPFIAMQEAEVEIPQEEENIFNVVVERKKNDITEAITQDPAEAARLLTTYIRE